MQEFRSMDEAEQLSGLIGGIYDAALEPLHWPLVLGNVAQFVGGPSATLFSKDASSKTGGAFYDFGVDDHYRQSYFEHYIKLDPATTGHFVASIEEPVATADLMPYEEFLHSRFYLEWARPQGLVDFIASVLDKSVTSAAIFGVFRHERNGVVDDETRRRMRLIAPHIRRSVLIGRLIDLKSVEAENFSGVLDSLSAGMFLVESTGRIVHANAAGHRMLAAGDPLRGLNGKFCASDPFADKSLQDVFAAAGKGDAAVGVKGIAVPLVDGNGGHHVAHVMPLTSGLAARREPPIALSPPFLYGKLLLIWCRLLNWWPRLSGLRRPSCAFYWP